MKLQQWPESAAPAPAFSDSRIELRRTLRLHEIGTFVSLAASICVPIAFTVGLIAALLESARSGIQTTHPNATEVVMATLCVLAWVPCCHYLWRCYHSGLQDVRDLHRQLNELSAADMLLQKEQTESAIPEAVESGPDQKEDGQVPRAEHQDASGRIVELETFRQRR